MCYGLVLIFSFASSSAFGSGSGLGLVLLVCVRAAGFPKNVYSRRAVRRQANNLRRAQSSHWRRGKFYLIRIPTFAHAD